MSEKFAKEKIARRDRLIKYLGVALTNSALYSAHHPAFNSSIKPFKDILDMCLVGEERIELGISPDTILFNGAFVKEKSESDGKVAGYLHKRGIIAISFTRGIEMAELIEFFVFLKHDAKVISGKGGITKNIGSMPHLIIKEIDYSSLLTSAKGEGALDEKSMWQSLSGIGKDLKAGVLPESKAEFMKIFLKDPKKSASALNKMYKEALAKLNDTTTSKELRDAFVDMSKYFEKQSAAGAKKIKKELADIIANLDPDLVASLFGDVSGKDNPSDLSNELFREFSDDMIADFITALMQNENNVNENMIRLFNKLVTERDGSGSVVSMVADKLFEKKLLGRNALSGLQNSITELFKTHPDNSFISQIYNLAVGSLVDRDGSAKASSEKYSVLVNEYREFLKEENLKKEKIRLLLNILWLEHDPARFKKINVILVNSFREVLDPGYIEIIKEIFELLTEKLSAEQMGNETIAAEVKNALHIIGGKETVNALLSFIPKVPHKALDYIAYVLAKTGEYPAGALLDSFMREDDKSSRNNLGYVLSKMDGSISKKISSRIEDAAGRALFPVINDLYAILKTVDVSEARTIAKKMMGYGNAHIRMQALEGFFPDGEEEANGMFKMFKIERNQVIKKMILLALVKTKNGEMIKKLFTSLKRDFFKNRFLPELIILCGDFKIQEALPFLGKILAHKPFFSTKKINALRIESVISLGRIGTPEAMEYIRNAANDRNESVRKMCGLVLESTKTANEKAI